MLIAVASGGGRSYLKVTQDDLRSAGRTEGRGGLGLDNIEAEQGAFTEMPVMVAHPAALQYDEESESDFVNVSGNRVYLNTADRKFRIKTVRVATGAASNQTTHEVNPNVSSDNGTYTVSPEFTGGVASIDTGARAVSVTIATNEKILTPEDLNPDSPDQNLLFVAGFRKLRDELTQAKIRRIELDDFTPDVMLTPQSGVPVTPGVQFTISLPADDTLHTLRFIIIRDGHIESRYTLEISNG